MNRCLRDRALLLIHHGEGTESDRAHLRECLRCAARHQELVHDLEAIGRVLREAPPVAAGALRPSTGWRRRLAVGAALAAVVGLAGLEVWMWHESVSWVRPQENAGDAETLRFLEKVSAVLSSTDEGSGPAIAMFTPPPDFTDMTGAPEVEWPDEWQEGPGAR